MPLVALHLTTHCLSFFFSQAASVGLTITMIIFGSMSFVTAFLTLLLPETKDRELVDRIQG